MRAKDFTLFSDVYYWCTWLIPVAVLPATTVSKVTSMSNVSCPPVHSTITIAFPSNSVTVYVVGNSQNTATVWNYSDKNVCMSMGLFNEISRPDNEVHIRLEVEQVCVPNLIEETKKWMLLPGTNKSVDSSWLLYFVLDLWSFLMRREVWVGNLS